MTPIDDELRSALSSRTDHVELSPDFFSGVERRARGLRRRKAAATVAGGALAVSALGVGGPVVASLLDSSSRTVAPPATSPGVDRYALDPASPWEYRGDRSVLEASSLDVYTDEWAVRRGLRSADVSFTPLFGQVDEPSGGAELVYLVTTPADSAAYWGVVRSTESGPEFVVDVPLPAGTTALPAALPGDEAPRLLVVASPEVGDTQYGPDAASEWSTMTEVADGVSVTPLEGDPATDRLRVLDPAGSPVFEGEAPDPVAPQAPEDEGPGTETPVDVDPAPYAFDLADPWAYRGPTELTQHPDLSSQDLRLFEAGGSGRDTGDWSDRPLLAVERPDGLSVLMMLHFRGDEAYVTTTWQVQDEAARQSEQPISDGTLVVQSFLPLSDGTGVLVALAAPRTGAVETDVRALEQVHNEEGYGVWEAPAEVPAGQLFLYSEGDGLLFHSEPLRRS